MYIYISRAKGSSICRIQTLQRRRTCQAGGAPNPYRATVTCLGGGIYMRDLLSWLRLGWLKIP